MPNLAIEIGLTDWPIGGGGHCVLKWGFKRTFPGNKRCNICSNIVLDRVNVSGKIWGSMLLRAYFSISA